MDRGYSFHWPVGSRPYLLLPGGQRLNLTVDGRIPYISSAGSEAWGQVGVAAASVLKRWGCAMNGANSYLFYIRVVKIFMGILKLRLLYFLERTKYICIDK